MINLRFHTQLYLVSILLLFSQTAIFPETSRQVFYVDCYEGNDDFSGNSPEKAWRSLANVNEVEFMPGSLILFKSDCLWSGQLYPKGSGMQDHPIIIDRYGPGNLPIIDGGAMEGEGVMKLFNQSFWEINNLEITNFSTVPGDRRGVEIKASNAGLVRHIHLKNLKIHDIQGIVGNSLVAKKTAGIYIAVVEDDKTPTRFDDVLIEGCEIFNVQNQGIVTNNEVNHTDYPGTDEWHKRKFTNVRVRNNVIHHISKNAMIIRLAEGGIVEHNLCYETALGISGNTIFSRSSRNTVFQFNEGFSNKSIDYDGSLYDPDFSSPGTIWQYSYSHDNAHGLIWICTSKEDRGIIVRHNLSKNDRGNIFYVNYPFTQARIHHNQVYIGANRKPVLLRENPGNSHTYAFDNNTIFNHSEHTKVVLDGSVNNKQHRTLAQNLYIGNFPQDDSGELFSLSQWIKADIQAVPSAENYLTNNIFVPEPTAVNEWESLGNVNGIPLTTYELQIEKNKLRAKVFSEWSNSTQKQIAEDIWESEYMENGNSLGDELHRAAMENLIRRKVEQSVLVEKRLEPESSMLSSEIFKKWLHQNSLRESAKSEGLTIYGPVSLSESQFMEYVFLNQIIQLKDQLDGKEIDTDAVSLANYYETHQDLFNSRNHFSKYTENEAAVKIYLIDEKYEAWIDNLVESANIDLFMD